jgi:formate dehydrogenase subunit gamma
MRCSAKFAERPRALTHTYSTIASAATLIAFLFMSWSMSAPAHSQSSVRPPPNATTSGEPSLPTSRVMPGRPPSLEDAPIDGHVPGGVLGNRSQSDIWRALREGQTGIVSIPDEQAGNLIHGARQRLNTEAEIQAAMRSASPEGSIAEWVEFRSGPLATYGAYAMGGTIVLLALFFLVRGRIRIERGLSGLLIERFSSVERIGHWLLAISFIILAVTGLNLLYGRHVMIPAFGPETYAAITYYGKLSHSYVAFAFMAGLVLIFVNWIRHNIPHPRDLVWLAKGGGLFMKGVHPSAKKFNAGQKIIFWLVILGGVSISLSGIALMFPFQTDMFGKTFAFMNMFGLNLPTALTPIQEMQYQSLWHSIMALFLICVIMAHIYIGSIGMEGAIEAVTTGMVDENWAMEHHDLWLEEIKAAEREARGAPGSAGIQAAE